MLFRSFKEPFSGTLVKIFNCWAFSPFETVPGSLIRSVQFLSVDNRAILWLLKYAQAWRIFPLKSQINFWNLLTFLNGNICFCKEVWRNFWWKFCKHFWYWVFSPTETARLPGHLVTQSHWLLEGLCVEKKFNKTTPQSFFQLGTWPIHTD